MLQAYNVFLYAGGTKYRLTSGQDVLSYFHEMKSRFENAITTLLFIITRGSSMIIE